MPLVISEEEFRLRLVEVLSTITSKFDYVVGPGRSGAIASAYASHILKVPFVPYKCKIPNKIPLIVDTAHNTGATLRKASRYYDNAEYVFCYNEPPRVIFWYEVVDNII